MKVIEKNRKLSLSHSVLQSNKNKLKRIAQARTGSERERARRRVSNRCIFFIKLWGGHKSVAWDARDEHQVTRPRTKGPGPRVRGLWIRRRDADGAHLSSGRLNYLFIYYFCTSGMRLQPCSHSFISFPSSLPQPLSSYPHCTTQSPAARHFMIHALVVHCGWPAGAGHGGGARQTEGRAGPRRGSAEQGQGVTCTYSYHILLEIKSYRM